MAVATIKLVNSDNMFDFYLNKDQVEVARRLLKQGSYTTVGDMGVPGLEGEAAAEEVFDLTNNPSREEERDQLYDRRYRSLSVGDIVRVDGVSYLCASYGWEVL